MQLKKATLTFSVINAATFGMGFAFNTLLARRLGAGRSLDCLTVGVQIFGLTVVLWNFMTALLIPVFNEVRARDPKDAFRFADVVLKWTVGVSLGVTVILWAGIPALVRLMAPGFGEEATTLAVGIARVLILGMAFGAASATLALLLQASYHFTVPAAGQLVAPAVNLVLLFVAVPRYGVRAVAVGYLLANVIRAAWLLVYLWLRTDWRPTLSLYHPMMPRLVAGSSVMAASGLVAMPIDIVVTNLASRLPPGVVFLFDWARRLVVVLLRVVVFPASRVLHARASEWIALGKLRELGRLLGRVIRANVSVVLLLSAGAVVFMAPAFRLLFRQSCFSEADVGVLTNLVIATLGGLVVLAVEQHLLQVVRAWQKPLWVGVGCLARLTAFLWMVALFVGRYEAYALAVAFGMSHVASGVAYWLSIPSDARPNALRTLRTVAWAAVVAFALGFAGLLLRHLLDHDVIMVVVVGPLWTAAAAGTVVALLPGEMAFLRFPRWRRRG